jgi:putative ABC transport system ATP-binding protein
VNDPVVQLSAVTRTFDADPPALDAVTLTVARGESVAVLGPSGSGKSTLLNIVAGLDRPTSGTVTVAGSRLNELGEARLARFRRAHIGLVFQFFHLLDELTVLDNTALPARLAGVSRRTALGRATGLLDRLGIGRLAHAYPARLSGGERQRVAVARSLVNKPVLLLADEPTGNLDRHTAQDVGQLLLDLNRQEGNILLVVTHSAELAALFPRRLEMIDGALKSVGGET